MPESKSQSPSVDNTIDTSQSTSPPHESPQGKSALGSIATPGLRLGVYELQTKLGQGGMGAVYLALHTKLGKVVAIKILPELLTHDPATVARFEREMQAVGLLEHPNIVRAMDAGEANGTHFLVMEYVEGVDLRTYVDQRGPLPIHEACRITCEIAEALDYAHARSLIHRDIKPSNVLITSSGHVKLLDLGLAKLLNADSREGLTQTGVSMGTPDYMAPEQWDNLQAVDARSDLYSLGCMLFFLLTGRAPYDDDRHRTVSAKLAGHTLHPIPSPYVLRREVPREVEAIYEKLVAKNPNDRFQTAAKVVHALGPLGKEPLNAAPSRGTLARKLWAPLAIAAVLIITIGVLLGIVYWNRDNLNSEDVAIEADMKPSAQSEPPLAEAPFTAEEAKELQEAWAKHLGVPVDYQCPLGIEFKLIPPGKFLMGTSDEELVERTRQAEAEGWPSWRIANLQGEGPQHGVTITKAFYCSVHEITVAEFRSFVELASYTTQAEKENSNLTWRTPTGTPAPDDAPVRHISFEDAMAFCSELERLKGVSYRLLTEAEWEYACRSGTTTPYYFGDTLTTSQAAIGGTPDDVKPAGSFPLNAFGLYDMHGNVREWCQDSITPRYDPAASIDPVIRQGDTVVVRGGSVNITAEAARSAIRRGDSRTNHNDITGFRVALPIHAAKKSRSDSG